ncbi:MAG: TonB-dependent receptor [Emcibacter sp.]|nr:TonB-dependent receptor [Emcibacter sp.]
MLKRTTKRSYAARAVKGTRLILLAGLASGVSMPSMAQTQNQDQETSNQIMGLDEVVVTAQRREQNIQDVAVAVTVLPGQELLKRGLHDMLQLQYATPSLQANARSSAPGISDFYIRGVGTGVFSNAIEYDVSTILDDVVLTRPQFASLQFFDVDRVEVLRGPQTTLFGKNASAGVVNVTTKRPSLGEYEVKAHFEVAAVNSPGTGFNGRLEAVVNAPITDDSAVRVSAFGIYQSAFVHNPNPNAQSDFAFREGGIKLKYLWQPTEKLHVYVIGDYARESGVATGAFTLRELNVFAPFPAVLAQANDDLGIVPGPDNLQNGSNAPYESNFKVGGAQIEVGYDWENGFSLSNIFAWRFFKLEATADSDYTSVNYFDTVASPLDDRQFTNEIRLISPAGGVVEGQGGIFLYSGRYGRKSHASANLGTPNPLREGFLDATHRAKSVAAFAQFTVHPTDDIRLIAGGRYTYDDIALRSTGSPGTAPFSFFPLGTLDQARTHSNFAYKISTQYDVSEDMMAYVSYTRGYKGPAFNVTASTIAAVAVDPEIPVAWELGFKSTLFQGRATLNIALFSQMFNDYQTTSLDPLIGQTVLQNAGKAQSKGVEVEFSAKVTRSLTLHGGFAYVNAKIREFPNAPCYRSQTVAEGCIILVPGAPGRPAVTAYDASGNPLAQAPKFTVSATMRYEKPISDNLNGFASLSGYYRTESNFSINQDPHTKLPAYARLDMDMGVSADDDSWRLAFFVQNLTNKLIPSYIQASVGAAGAYQQSFSQSSFRVIGLNGTFRY